MAHTIKSKKQLLTRVRKIKGQAAALEAALEQDKDCLGILQQIAAVRGAVNGLMAEVMEGHIREHLVADGLSAQERQEEADKVAALLRSYLK
ncbi:MULTISPECIES: metal/formaldehyde-sensitive transcriptional repressor [Pseudomonas]|uniref:metal/formaldehyde-sensitive transcriptional repressor n=1 Tax=Pseudomonas TaxID=286 RepID=UPI0018A9FCE6|nr:metal/formaldehyde-sensitive transcriptional repressor [Pseudomonas guariconensis]MBF8720849.1 metal/formaldehyde-sensitive transcriptional repressor [Pseudomonas guariconensis]MBF8743123.1 metal/formaldehyde-sensitive transcriptional repressor [Pseudomonas guariconensis]MBF8752737.1 metal/formaldehyde-sensitive transcriptional repressor [Pseudomonas guariconensis]MBF8795264.1 metal/formaldehyde-sensitive transcriptional repressor [Pseudomonas monteilii]